MQIALLGSGMMGKAIAYDLSRNEKIERILVCDIDLSCAEAVAEFVGSPKVIPTWVDVRNLKGTKQAIEGSAVIVSAIHYQFNYDLSRAAIELGAHFVDLGGNNHMVQKQLSLHEQARQRGVTIIPDTGLAPGLVQVLTAHGAKHFSSLEDIQLRVGGLPQNPTPPLNYNIVFSVDGLINEYIEDAIVVRNGEVDLVSALSELETLAFDPPYDELEAFQTSGGTSTLPITYQGKIRNLDYKTIRYAGHRDLFRTLIELGFCSSKEIPLNGTKITPRKITGWILEDALKSDDIRDVVLVMVKLSGQKDGTQQTLTYRMVDLYDEATGLTAMMRSTGFPSAIITQMLAEDKIAKKGVVPQEVSVPTEEFFEAMNQRGFRLEEHWG